MTLREEIAKYMYDEVREERGYGSSWELICESDKYYWMEKADYIISLIQSKTEKAIGGV